MVRMYLIFQETSKLSLKIAIPFYISISNEWELLFLHILVSISCCQCSGFLAILICVQWYLVVILICISLMMYNMEHLFLYLFAICISSLVRCLLRPLAHFLISSLFSYGWVFRILCIFCIIVLYQMCILQICFPV